VFFTNGGEVRLDLSAVKSSCSVRWFDIRNGKIVSESKTDGGKIVKLKAPGELEWVAVVKK
jgi:hypothetical protein